MMVLIMFLLTLSWVIAIFRMVAINFAMHTTGKSLKVDSLKVWAILAISSLSNFRSSQPRCNFAKSFFLYFSSSHLLSMYNPCGGRLEVPLLSCAKHFKRDLLLLALPSSSSFSSASSMANSSSSLSPTSSSSSASLGGEVLRKLQKVQYEEF